MTKNESARIDRAAVLYFETREKRHFEDVGRLIGNIVRMYVSQKCAGSVRWDKDELFSILFEDMWRLFQVYKPEVGKKFHWLMLRQLSNKTRNYIKNTTGRRYKNCFICNESHNNNEDTCIKCGSSLRKPHAATGQEHYDLSHYYTPNYLKDLENKQIIERLLAATEGDPKTNKILRLMLEGYRKIEISDELKLAPNAMNSRLRKCRETLNKLE